MLGAVRCWKCLAFSWSHKTNLAIYRKNVFSNVFLNDLLQTLQSVSCAPPARSGPSNCTDWVLGKNWSRYPQLACVFLLKSWILGGPNVELGCGPSESISCPREVYNIVWKKNIQLSPSRLGFDETTLVLLTKEQAWTGNVKAPPGAMSAIRSKPDSEESPQSQCCPEDQECIEQEKYARLFWYFRHHSRTVFVHLYESWLNGRR